MSDKAHGIMFHHFHDNHKHILGQGSISSESFANMLDYYGKTHNIISAEEFLFKSLSHTLSPTDVCLTFDDGLLCQYDIAYPVLRERGLTAFWFIYTSPLDGVKERLEIYRHFRFSMFSDIEEFYSAFFDMAEKSNKDTKNAMKSYNPNEYLKESPFYTPNDKRFRYMRDVVLGAKKYDAIMDRMIEECKYDIDKNSKLLWLSVDHIKVLHQQGHIIGLHSYSHPTVMGKKDYIEQKQEYGMNKKQLEDIIRTEIQAVSYPCNSYNADTLRCMREFGIKIGFRANMADICLERSYLEYSREDHANILKAMEK